MSKLRGMFFLFLCLGFASGCAVSKPTPSPQPTVQLTPLIFQPTETQVPATQTPTPAPVLPGFTPTARIMHLSTPEDPAERFESQILDADSSAYAKSKRVAGGDNFDAGEFERPFNAETMDQYFPDLDIIEAGLRRSGDWIYVTIKLAGMPKGSLLSESYGVEIDVDADGRGDFLIIASKPGLMWSVDGVSIWRDANRDVGGGIAVKADGSKTGDGFELQLFDSGKGFDTDAAWARVNPNDFSSVQIAFKKTVIDNDKAFLWNAWAQDSIQPSLFDYNDHFTLAEAGSPLPAQSGAYPLKKLSKVDNTCRWAAGFSPTGAEPGLCPLSIESAGNGGETFIHGLVWYDRNANFYQDPGEPGFENLELVLAEGICGMGGKILVSATTAINGTYEIHGVPAGSYCLTVTGPIPPGVKPVKGSGPQTVNLKAGAEVKVNFPFVLSSP
ncbi:MAG: SdrD B-like domain-containing protein [Anaerolineaceae bacterium]